MPSASLAPGSVPTSSAAHSPSQLARRRLFLLAAIAIVPACKKSHPAACTDVSGLSASDIALRKTLAYVDRSPNPNTPCEDCVQWLPADTPDRCGACKVMKGPVHPLGFCKLFAAK